MIVAIPTTKSPPKNTVKLMIDDMHTSSKNGRMIVLVMVTTAFYLYVSGRGIDVMMDQTDSGQASWSIESK